MKSIYQILFALYAGLLSVEAASSSVRRPELRGQIVRIELPGENRVLALAEVCVFSKGVNLAKNKKATQSSVAYSGKASHAVDGNRDGDYMLGSVTHTEPSSNPWWEVDLGAMVSIDEIVVYNRTDSHGVRLNGFTLKVLDGARSEVFARANAPQASSVSFLKPGVKSSRVAASSKPATPVKISKRAKSGPKDLGAIWFIGDSITQSNADADSQGSPRKFLYDLLKAYGYDLDNTPARLRALLDEIYALPNVGKPKVFLGTIPRNRRNEADRTNVIIFNESVPRIVLDYRAKSHQIYLVDQFKALDDAYSDTMRGDNLHPNGTGNHTMAREWFAAIQDAESQGDFADSGNGEMLFPREKSDFRGYDRYDRVKTARGHISIICPKEPAPGKPWLWRSLFWEAIKQFSDADLKLVHEGYHVVIAHGDVSGHPKGNAAIDAAYDLLTTEYGFAKTCSMASMSRGTLSLFRWASENPEKVNSIYVDNGFLNVLSWPAGYKVPGNQSTSNGDAGSWGDYKKKFGYATDAEALKTKESPIDLLEPLAKAGVTILTVFRSKDHAVPYEENDAILEERYKALGGDITVIIEDKGLSHGMKDPTPVLEFIKKHTSTPTS